METPKYSIFQVLHQYFDLAEDSEAAHATILSVRKGVEFRGANLWVLIFAILIASVGLNVNSTAVIIGAMLISPLMGPIMGIGVGVGINDFSLIKKAVTNLFVAVLMSILTSTIYYVISPLRDAQPELLARTTPTIWDVLIAFFGGMAGIIAITRREKGNAVPGVAIATALMPPLCTAGYSIANGKLYMFLGAFYLFFINSVFISVSTFLIVRFLKYPKIEFVDKSTERRVIRYIWLAVILTLLPSIYLGYAIVQRSIYERNAKSFIQKELNFEKSQVIRQNIDPLNRKIEVFLLGEHLSNAAITLMKQKLHSYNLTNTSLMVRQGEADNRSPDLNTIKTGIIEEIYKKNEALVRNKDDKIALLEKELTRYKTLDAIEEDISHEVKAEHPKVQAISLAETVLYHTQDTKHDTLMLAYIEYAGRFSAPELKRLEAWLKVRTKAKRIKLIVK